MTEQLLYVTKVGASLEHVRRRSVAQAVRPDVGYTRHGGDRAMHHRPHHPRIQPATPGTEQQGGRRTRAGQSGTARVAPGPERSPGRNGLSSAGKTSGNT